MRTFLAFMLVALAAVSMASPSMTVAGGVPRHTPAEGLACGTDGMVATSCPLATSVGQEILAAGGNAVDAAVAVGFALAVTHPAAGNIGGGGFMLIRLAGGAASFIDFREKAPLAASRDMYLDADGRVVEGASLVGHRASGIPGTVAGFAMAHRKYGSLPWERLIEPAEKLAREGFAVSPSLAASLAGLSPYFKKYPGLAVFKRPDGTPLRAGDLFRQTDLAATLERISRDGPDEFYRGRTAELILEEMRSGGGIITSEDLAQYGAIEREPVTGTYRGYEILTAPPPSSGGVILVEMLNILEGWDLASSGFHSADAVQRMVEAERRAYCDRAHYLGDPDFVNNPITALTSKEYANYLRLSVGARATLSSDLPQGGIAGYEGEETTHYSIVDAHGNAVATTYTLNDSYGSKVVVRGGGFLLNDEMDDFSLKPGTPNLYGLVGNEANAIEPGKRMLSSMAPTILTREGRIAAVLGTPGGSTIITTVAQIMVNVIDFCLESDEAVSAARFHHQWLPDVVYFERHAFPASLLGTLEERGYQCEQRDPIGDAQIIWIRDGAACGISDPRHGGAAGGAAERTVR